VRPGRPEDLPAISRLWEHLVVAGLRDAVLPEAEIRRALAGFDWEACSRVEEGAAGVRGWALVLRREADGQIVTRVEAAVAPGETDELTRSLVGWGLGLSRAAGARIAQVWRARGTTEWLGELGMQPVRPWWRMDRSMDVPLPPAVPVEGYHLLDPAAVPAGAWADLFNRAFADHWRFAPRAEGSLRANQMPELSLMAADSRGAPAAMALCEIERYPVDTRPQPVGIVGSVGTLPAHRRRGLAAWLVAEALARLQAVGVATASLYVDGKNETRAADLYARLGFVVTFDTTVWEATFPP
jgi:ribosomal protein S18 acetylase RimI-like enzyme